MREIWLVCKHEIGTTLRRVSFWVFSLLMPVLLLGLNTTALMAGNRSAAAADSEEPAAATVAPAAMPRVGLVDESGLITTIPAGTLSEIFTAYTDAEMAAADLAAGRLDQYVVVAADYVTSGRVTVYDESFQILSSGDDMGLAFGSDYAWTLPYLLSVNLVGEAALAAQVLDPLPYQQLTQTALAPPPAPGESEALGEIVAMALPYAFYFLLLIGSNYLMRSVVAEKENRTAELLLLTLRPRDLMIGKILGLGLVTLVQLFFWLGGAIFALQRSADWLQTTTFVFPPGFVIWAVIFLLLGYLLYASVMAMAGAVATNVKEAGQVIWLLIVPLMPTLMFGSEFVESPDSLLVVGLSLFPFSAPSAMVTRLALGDVPGWQLIVSLLGLAVTTYIVVQLAARSFRPRNLLAETAFSWRRLATGWRG